MSSFRQSGGFTLVEIMVVVAIIAAVVSIVLPRIDNRNNTMKAAVRRFSVLSKELHTRAKLKGATFRLAIDLKDGPESEQTQTYWVERSNQTVVLSEKEEKELQNELKEQRKDEPKLKDPNGFDPDPSVLKGKQELKKPLKFLRVEKKGYKDPITQGVTYIYFFPQGLSEEAIIQIKASEKLQWSLAIHPLTGHADLVTRPLTLKELNE